MRPFTRNSTNPITLDQLVKICKAMETMSRVDAFKFGNEMGLSKHNVDSIRQMLGYSKRDNAPKLTPEQRDTIASEYEQGGVSMGKLAKKYGLAYNSIRCILVSRNVDTEDTRRWSTIQERRLADYVKRGISIRTIAGLMNKSKTGIEQKIKRMRRDGKI